MWLILETSDAENWAPHYGSRMIPAERRPTIAQPSRQVAECEALRLAKRHPGRRFLVLEAVCAGITVTVPTHITVGGVVHTTRSEARLVDVSEPGDEVPF
ncbi:MAG TPA: hypothetical protein VN201_05680 [Roseateles sp.]|nr:hypothetical protein [Roseateles sp.]